MDGIFIDGWHCMYVQRRECGEFGFNELTITLLKKKKNNEKTTIKRNYMYICRYCT